MIAARGPGTATSAIDPALLCISKPNSFAVEIELTQLPQLSCRIASALEPGKRGPESRLFQRLRNEAARSLRPMAIRKTPIARVGALTNSPPAG